MGILEHIQNELNTKKNNKLEEIPTNGTWGKLFYTSNIGILGLNLSDSEAYALMIENIRNHGISVA